MPTAKSIDEEHAKIYGRINGLESKVDETNGYLKGVVASNEQLLGILTKSQAHLKHALVLSYVFAFACLGALIYGAIGKDGLYSVRRTMPSLPIQADALPAHNDFDKNANNQRKETTK